QNIGSDFFTTAKNFLEGPFLDTFDADNVREAMISRIEAVQAYVNGIEATTPNDGLPISSDLQRRIQLSHDQAESCLSQSREVFSDLDIDAVTFFKDSVSNAGQVLGDVAAGIPNVIGDFGWAALKKFFGSLGVTGWIALILGSALLISIIFPGIIGIIKGHI